MEKIQKIAPFLWLDNQAEEVANYYIDIFRAVFPNEESRDLVIANYDEASTVPSGKPAGSVMVVDFLLAGQRFSTLNGGPEFKFTPATSFYVACDTEAEAKALWSKFVEGGKVMMELQKYPFSELYGWLSDKYGVSWQIFLGKADQRIAPCLMFTGKVAGKAEEAIGFYQSLFKNSKDIMMAKYGPDQGDVEGAVMHAEFLLDGSLFMAMDSHYEHGFTFSPAISFAIDCDTQEEVDFFWDNLGKGGVTSQCGWLDDKYGVTWQVVPRVLGELLSDPDPVKSQRVMAAMLEMTKLDIAKLRKAYESN